MRSGTPIAAALALVCAASVARAQPAPPPLSPRVTALAKKLAAHEAGAESAFWRQLAAEGTPLVEDVHEPGRRLVTFVWHGTAATQRVTLAGLRDDTPDSHLERLPGSNIFTTSLSLPDDGRYTYFFVVDADPHGGFEPGHFHHDPLNKRIDDPIQSVLELPNAPKQPSLVAHPGVAAGALWRHTLASTGPHKPPRQLYVYTPPGYDAKGPAYPLLVAFDAETATGQIPVPLILDELIAAKRIPPVVALLIGNVDRMNDLRPNAPFADFVALDLVPWVRAHYHATSDPRRSVISGISLGGLSAAYVGFRHPEVFGNVLSQSGSFWWGPGDEEPEKTSRDFVASPRLPLRFWMEVGTAEIGNPAHETTMLAANRHLRDVLKARGYDVSYHEFDGNHSYVCWRGTLADGLVALLATPPKLAAIRAPKAAPRPPLAIAPARRSSLSLLLRAALLDGGDAALTDAKRLLATTADGWVIDEDEVNAVGCLLLFLEHARASIPLFVWNTERFPKSWNTWDSLAWAYLIIGDRPHAIAEFKQSLAIDPKAPGAVMLNELTAKP